MEDKCMFFGLKCGCLFRIACVKDIFSVEIVELCCSKECKHNGLVQEDLQKSR